MDSTFYDRYWSGDIPSGDPTTSGRLALLKRTIRQVPSSVHVLDLGCGLGYFTSFMHELGYEAVGADVSSRAVEKARTAHPECSFCLIEGNRLPFEDERFALVWSSEVIEHVFDVNEHMSEVNRVLQPGGLYVLTTPYHGIIKNILISFLNFDRHFNPEVSHIRYFDRKGLTRCLVHAGFVPLSWSGVGRIWPINRSFFVIAAKRRPPERVEIVG